MVDFRPVAYVIGRILIVLAILMLAPAIIDWRAGLDNGHAFLASAALTGVTGAALTLSTGNALGRALDTRQAYLLTAGIWFLVPFFGALPFWIRQGVQQAFDPSMRGDRASASGELQGSGKVIRHGKRKPLARSDADGDVCAICMLPFTEPVVTKCMHRFCKACVTELLTKAATSEIGGGAKCPVCRQAIGSRRHLFAG